MGYHGSVLVVSELGKGRLRMCPVWHYLKEKATFKEKKIMGYYYLANVWHKMIALGIAVQSI